MMSKHQRYTLQLVLVEVFVDEDSDFDPDIANSSTNSSGQQVSETGGQENVEIRDNFQCPYNNYSFETLNFPVVIVH